MRKTNQTDDMNYVKHFLSGKVGRLKKTISALVVEAMLVSGASAVGNGVNISAADTKELTSAEVNSIYKENFEGKSYDRVSVHDPSVVIGYIEDENYTSLSTVYGEQNDKNTRTEVYFIFGSHLAFAYSKDLKNWKYFKNNLNTDYKTIFKDGFEWSDNGDSAYSPSGNMWAPDVIWNPYYENADGTTGAWTMYMSINGCSWNSSIALLTAKSLNGSWTYQGTVVYSGFTASGVYSYEGTDYKEVTGDVSLPSRYIKKSYTCKDGNTTCSATTWSDTYGAHAIDPCIIFDGNELYMTYGSWSGGIYMLKMNPKTGLRDKATTYTYQKNASDPYMGYMLAGGNFASGEASYIEKIGNKYYLFLSYGGLTAFGGYNMRVFTSNAIKGPYKDLQGNDARTGYSAGAGATNGTVGNRLMTYYKWDFQSNGQVAQGHNSAFVDDDGKAYVVYHTRFNNRGEVHEVRVHQLFQAQNGGLVTAPFEYSGETLSATAYAVDKVTGEYNILTMKGTDNTKLECVTEEKIVLNANGTVSGAYSGSWSQAANAPYVTLTIGGVTYQGVFIEQNMEESATKAMTLTVVGKNDISIWGYKSEISAEDAIVAYNAKNTLADIPDSVFGGNTLELPEKGHFGADYTWESLNSSLITNDGKVQNAATDTNVTLRLTISKGKYKYIKKYTVKVLSAASKNELLPLADDAVLAEYADKAAANAAAPNKTVSAATGLSFSMYAPEMENDWVTVLQNKEKSYLLQFATISYSKNNEWCWYYEAAATLSAYAEKQGYTAANIWEAFTDGPDGAYYLTISFNKDGSISYYRDGNLMMTYASTLKPSNGTVNITVADISKQVISDYLAGKIEIEYDKVKNIVIGYQADADSVGKPVPTPTPTSTPTPTPTPQPDDSAEELPEAAGTVLTDNEYGCKVKVLSDNAESPTVSYMKPSAKKANVVVPAKITKNGVTYRVTAIAGNAFKGNKKLISVTVGKNITSIGKNAFKDCKNLSKIVFKGTAWKKTGAGAFKNLSGKVTVQVPKAGKAAYTKLLKKAGFKGTIKSK